MTEEAIVSNLKHTVSFTRKVSPKQYESADATFFLQFDTPEGASFEDIIEKAQRAFVAAKGVVLSELGINYDFDAEGILVETGLAPRESAAAPTAAPKQTLQSTPDATTQLREAFNGGTVSEDTTVRQVNFGGHDSSIDPLTLSKAEQKKWLAAELKANPGAFYDNRTDKRNPKAPDWKHKTSGLGIWAA